MKGGSGTDADQERGRERGEDRSGDFDDIRHVVFLTLRNTLSGEPTARVEETPTNDDARKEQDPGKGGRDGKEGKGVGMDVRNGSRLVDQRDGLRRHFGIIAKDNDRGSDFDDSARSSGNRLGELARLHLGFAESG